MPTRPSQGGSAGTWGAELNAWLDVGHNADGTVKPFITVTGADPTGVADSGPAIQAALDSSQVGIGGRVGGPVILPRGNYMTNQQIVVPNVTIFTGVNMGSTRLFAGPSFPTSTAMVRLGPAGTSNMVGVRCERMTIDCNDVVGSIGVYNHDCQEQSGCFRLLVNNFRTYGVWFDTTGAQNSGIESIYALGSASGSTYCVYFKSLSGQVFMRDLSLGGNGASPATSCIRIEGTYVFRVEGAHVHTATNGIDITGSQGVCDTIEGHSSLTNTLKTDGNSNDRMFVNIYKNGGTNILNDGIIGITYTDTYIDFFSERTLNADNHGWRGN